MNSSIDPIFNSYKVKFNIMNELFESNNIKFSTNKKVNVFINLDSLIRTLTSENILRYLVNSNNENYLFQTRNFISNIFNLAAHYRRYFSARHIYSDIYLYMTFPFKKDEMDSDVYIPEYRKDYSYLLNKPSASVLTQTVIDSITMAQIIDDYIEGVYLITTNKMETSLIPGIINDKLSDTESDNLLITKDKYEYQYSNMGYTILRPKLGDESYIITQDNLMETLKKEFKVKNDKNISPSFYSFILCLLGDKFRNIPKMNKCGVSTLFNIISKSIDKNIINKSNNSIQVLSRLFKGENQMRCFNNFMVTDIKMQLKLLSMIDPIRIKNQLIDKFDNNSLLRLDVLFQDTPINIEDLTEALKFKYSTFKNNNIGFEWR